MLKVNLVVSGAIINSTTFDSKYRINIDINKSGGGTPPPPTTIHNDLFDRDALNAHPVGSITGAAQKPIQITNITLLQSGWSLSAGFYQYTYSNINILSTSIVNVTPLNASIPIVKAADFMPQTTSSAGNVIFYCTNAPSGDIIVDLTIIYL